MAICAICHKMSVVGKNVPKSVHKTSRTIKPNLQKWNGLLICTRCRRSMKKYQTVVA